MKEQYTFDDLELRQFPTEREKLLQSCPSQEIQTSFIKHYYKIASYEYGGKTVREFDRIMVSVSGGSDSDIVIDMMERIGHDAETKVHYVFFDTGMEFKATKKHLDNLEEKYGIKIDRIKAKTPVPIACKDFGQPFLSKQISEYICRLQKHGFLFEDKPFDELYKQYPKCKAALRWWCNEWGENSRLNIARRKFLKEFMVLNPPTFLISAKCCDKAKKETAHEYEKSFNPDLNVIGVRKGGGGARSTAIHSCFDQKDFGTSVLRPVFWFSEKDKRLYEEAFDVRHSDCYEVYGLKRTGCACCPFGKNFEKELAIAEKYERGLYLAANHVFKDAYEYTRAYFEFRDRMKNELG